MTDAKTIDALIKLMEPELQEIFLEVMQDVVDRASLQDMIAAIQLNNPEALFRATGMTPAALEPFIDKIEEIYKQAGNITASTFPSVIRSAAGVVVFRFQMRNLQAENDIRTNSSRLINALTEEARQNVRTTLERGLVDGRNPRSVALDIVGRVDPKTRKRVGGIIGLTTRQERWISNARQYITSGDEKYFNLNLRDKRFDSQIQKYFDQGKKPPNDLIERSLISYKNKALRYRSEVISRTETIQSINRAEYRTYMQAVQEGAINQERVKRYWDSTMDGRTRFTHKELERKTRKEPIGLDEPFISESGDRLMHPGDTSLGASAKEVVQCRCRVRYKVDRFSDVE